MYVNSTTWSTSTTMMRRVCSSSQYDYDSEWKRVQKGIRKPTISAEDFSRLHLRKRNIEKETCAEFEEAKNMSPIEAIQSLSRRFSRVLHHHRDSVSVSMVVSTEQPVDDNTSSMITSSMINNDCIAEESSSPPRPVIMSYHDHFTPRATSDIIPTPFYISGLTSLCSVDDHLSGVQRYRGRIIQHVHDLVNHIQTGSPKRDSSERSERSTNTQEDSSKLDKDILSCYISAVCQLIGFVCEDLCAHEKYSRLVSHHWIRDLVNSDESIFIHRSSKESRRGQKVDTLDLCAMLHDGHVMTIHRFLELLVNVCFFVVHKFIDDDIPYYNVFKSFHILGTSDVRTASAMEFFIVKNYSFML